MDPYGAQYDDQPPYERAMYAGPDLSSGFDPLAGAVWVPDPPPQPLRMPQEQRDVYYYDQDMQQQQQFAQVYSPQSQNLPPTPAHSFQSTHHQPQSHAQPLQYRPYELHPLPQQQQQYLPPTPALTTTRYPEGLVGPQQQQQHQPQHGDPNKRRRVDDGDFASVAIAAGAGAPGATVGTGPLAQAVHPAEDYFRLPVASSPPRSHRVVQGPGSGFLAGALDAQSDLAAQAQAIARRRASVPAAANSWPMLERQVAAQVATRRPSGAHPGTSAALLPSVPQAATAPSTAVHATSTPPLIPPSSATTAARPAQLFLSTTSAPPSVSPVVTVDSISAASAGPSNFGSRPRPAAQARTNSEEDPQRPVDVSPTLSALAAEGQTQVSKSEKSCKACRIRKVRCSRTWPVCTRCTEKNLDCHYGNLIPIDLVKGMHPDSRVAELEARIKMLEHEILMRDDPPRHARGFGAHTRGSSTSMFSSPMPPAHPALRASPSAPPRPSPLRTDSSESQPHAAPPTLSLLSSAPPRDDFSRTVYGVFVNPFWGALTEPGDPTGTRRRHVDAVVASVHERAFRLGSARRARYASGTAPEDRGSGATQGRLGLSEAICPGKPGHGVSAGSSPEEDQFAEMAQADVARVAELVGLDMEELAQDQDWARMAIWAVLDAHWATCSSNVPAIRPFHLPMRQAHMYARIDALSPSLRCILLAFCAIGVRSTPYVGLFGLAGGPALGRDGEAVTEGVEEEDAHIGLKRELVARSLRDAMIELYGRLELAYGEATKDALEASLILALVQMWNEIKPRYSRSLVRNAIAQYKELFDSAADLPDEEAIEAERTDLLMMYALPLLHIDSTTAAYLRAAPVFTNADLDVYLAPFKIPRFHRFDAKDGPGEMDLRDQMRPWIDVDAVGDANHVQHTMGSMVIYQWLSACLRWCAQMSCPQARRAPLPPAALGALFEHLSVIHGTIQLIQYHLTQTEGAAHPDCLAPAPDGDTADHIHLRWLTRLDRETDDATWLVFSIVSERLVREDAEDQRTDFRQFVKTEDERLDVGWLQACESRVRKGFKLAAFYFNFFTMSPDPHQTHHLACSLELIPNWTFLATQRYIPSGNSPPAVPHYSGLRSKADELTETELDWIERGLELARKYHPVAERRLVEFRSYRLAEKKRMELLAAEGVAIPTSRAGPMPSTRLGQKSPLSFQLAMKRALNQTVPSWA